MQYSCSIALSYYSHCVLIKNVMLQWYLKTCRFKPFWFVPSSCPWIKWTINPFHYQTGRTDIFLYSALKRQFFLTLWTLDPSFIVGARSSDRAKAGVELIHQEYCSFLVRSLNCKITKKAIIAFLLPFRFCFYLREDINAECPNS